MRIEYKTNYSGFLVVFRAVLFLVRDKKLNLTQLGAYFIFITQASYDERHKQHYTAIIRSDQEIAKELGISYDTIHKHRKSLINLGLLVEKNGITYVPNFYLFKLHWSFILVKLLPEYLRLLFVNPPSGIDDIPKELVKMQEDRTQNKRKGSNSSSNEDSTSSEENTEDELREYFKEVDIETDDIK